MSYILDALRRAEAERERGSVPGLHTQPVAAPTAPLAPARLQPVLWWAGSLAILLLLATLAWLLLSRPAVPEPAAVVAAPRAAPAPAPVVLPAAPVAIAPSEAMQVVPVPVAPAPLPRAAAASAPVPSAPASAASPAPTIVPWERLPESQRRLLPALAISGAIWSESAANRMLIVSGLLLHEGDTAAPGVVLEQIRPKSAVLRWKDLHYEVSF